MADLNLGLQALDNLAVVPILIGPLQVLIAILPGLLLSLGAALFALFKPSTFIATLKIAWRLKLPLLLIAAVVTGAVYGTRAIFPEGGGAVSQAEDSDQTSPGFRGGLDRRGWQPGFPDPAEAAARWTFDRRDRTFYASPAVAGNRLYIASSQVSAFNPTGTSELYCLDADTGGLVWRSGPPGYRATFSSVAIGERHIAVGEGLHLTKDSRLTLLDRETGEMIWKYRSNSHMESSPAIGENEVVVGAGQDGFYCFELEPDSDGNPVIRWHAPGPLPYADASGSPAIYQGRAYLPLGRWGGRTLACLDLATGEELWRTEVPYPVFSGPTFAHGQVFIGMGNGNFIQSAEEALPGELDRLRASGLSEEEVQAQRETLLAGGAVWSLDPETGAVNWRQSLPRNVLGQVAAGEDFIFATSRDGSVYRFAPDGRMTGSWSSGAPILASPAVAEEHVYILNERGRLIALRQDTLRPVWEMSVGSGWPFISSPTVARGMVYVGTINGGVVAVGQPAGERPPAIWHGSMGGAGAPGRIDDEALGDRGAVRWRFEGDKQLQVTAPAVRIHGRTLIANAHAEQPGLICLSDGRDARAAGEAAWTYATPHGVHRSAAADEERVVLVDGKPGDEGRHLHVLNLENGQRRWQLPVASQASGALRLDDKGILAAINEQGLSALSLDGETLWEASPGRVHRDPVVSDSLIVVATDQPAGVAVIDRYSGTVLWQQEHRQAAVSNPVLDSRRIMIDDGESIIARDLINGSLLWQRQDLGPITSGMVGERARLALTTAAGQLHVLDVLTGENLLSADNAQAAIPPLLGRRHITYLDSNGDWWQLSLGDGQRERWLAGRWLGPVTAPAISAEGGIYFPTEARGFVRAGRRE